MVHNRNIISFTFLKKSIKWTHITVTLQKAEPLIQYLPLWHSLFHIAWLDFTVKPVIQLLTQFLWYSCLLMLPQFSKQFNSFSDALVFFFHSCNDPVRFTAERCITVWSSTLQLFHVLLLSGLFSIYQSNQYLAEPHILLWRSLVTSDV